MTSNGKIHKHRSATVWHFLLDFFIVCLVFVIGTRLRFIDGVPGRPDESWLFQLSQYLPGVFSGALAVPVLFYIAGLYSPRISDRRSALKTGVYVTLLFVAATLVMLAVFYINFSTRVGRGVMLFSWPTTAVLLLAHHCLILRTNRGRRERIAYLITSAENASELSLLKDLDKANFEVAGVIAESGDAAAALPELAYLGGLEEGERVVAARRIDRVVTPGQCLRDPRIRRALCQMRYSGTLVSPVLSLCEEEFQLAPLELITANWLLTASDSPRLIYIKKIKRGFDVAASVACLAVLWPVLLAGMLLVRLSSRGPVFYRQERAGRFGNPFEVIKLRTMTVDAEKDGARWSSRGDLRLTPVGGFLRKYRIDEIPQLLNVLRGQMSFVGPRPERPEFVEQLKERIPWYLERLLIQPGLTGWAQVNYPYGSSVKDTVRKLEYDLYYMKHMGLYLDIAILLDTVRTILTGSVHDKHLGRDPLRRDLTKYHDELDALPGGLGPLAGLGSSYEALASPPAKPVATATRR